MYAILSLRKKRQTMKIMDNIPVWGEHEEKTLLQIRTSAATADRTALMADGHLGPTTSVL
jgi:hypothetical protein